MAGGSYTGSTRILAGTLKMGIDHALPPGTALTIDAGSTLDLSGPELTADTLDNRGSIIDSSCLGAILTVTHPPQTVVLPRSSMAGLVALADQWLVLTCEAPDWCMGADRDQDGSADPDDFEHPALNWLRCD